MTKNDETKATKEQRLLDLTWVIRNDVAELTKNSGDLIQALLDNYPLMNSRTTICKTVSNNLIFIDLSLKNVKNMIDKADSLI